MKPNLTSYSNRVPAAAFSCGLCLLSLVRVRADERRFTYTYEPEVMPAGGMEFEQWVTLRTQRTSGGEVKQGNYNLWEFREELEYGLTDNYSVSLCVNAASESFQDYNFNPPANTSSFDFKGISIENRYMVLKGWNQLLTGGVADDTLEAAFSK